MLINIAGIRIELVLPVGYTFTSDYTKAILSDYQDINQVPADFTLIALQADMERKIPIPCTTSKFSFAASGDRIIIHAESADCEIAGSEKKAVLSFLPNAERHDMLIADCLKILFSLLVIERGGLPMHSSAVVQKNEALVFFGPSGAGKSTIAEILAPSWQLLNDEMNVIIPDNNTYVAYATPFAAPANYHKHRKQWARLAGLFSLGKQTETRIELLPLNRQVCALAGSVYGLPLTDDLCQKIMANAADICRTIPVRKLFFSNKPSVTPSLKTVLSEAL
jgi:hypothetical protein